MAPRTTVVISQGPSNNPAKRELETSLALELTAQSQVDVVLIPHLYDLHADNPAILPLQQARGPFVLVSWLFPRAAHWTLAQLGIDGAITYADDAGPAAAASSSAETALPILQQRPTTHRTIHCVDIRDYDAKQPLVDAVRDQIRACGSASTASDGAATAAPQPSEPAPARGSTHSPPRAGRRWYPVIDYSRCTNCMECIDFCLFGVYGVDGLDTILVEQPDNCRKGCPACSRVCPENAIMFPQHKTPAIAGDPNADAAGAKLDLSQLFGGVTASDTAKQERAFHLAAAPADEPAAPPNEPAVTTPQQEPSRVAGPDTSNDDDLDALVDQLDQLDL